MLAHSHGKCKMGGLAITLIIAVISRIVNDGFYGCA